MLSESSPTYILDDGIVKFVQPFPMNEGEEDGPKTQLVQARGGHWKKLRALASYAFTNKALRQVSYCFLAESSE